MTVPTYNTVQRIIRTAYQNAGRLRGSNDPTTDQYNEGFARFKDLINTWQTGGLKLWLQYDLAIPLVAGQNSYSIYASGDVVMTRPTRIIDGGYYYYTTTGAQRPLDMIAKLDWDQLSSKVIPGSITSYYVQKLYDRLVVNFWPMVDSTDATNGEAHVQIQQQVSNYSAITDTLTFPIEWYLALTWGLADELATGQPQAIMDRCSQRAQAYREALEAWDVEDAPTIIAVDTQQGWAMSGDFE